MSTPKSNTPDAVASPEKVFALGVSFITKVNSLRLSADVVQAAKDQNDHPLWTAIENVFCPPPDALARQVAREEAARPRIEILSEHPKPCANRTVDEQVFGLKQMYEKLGWNFTESGLSIPKRQEGIDRLLVFADTKLTNNCVYDICDASFSSWRYVNDLNSAVPAGNDQRHPSRGVYATWVRDEVGPDQDLMGLSANTIAERGLNIETLLEYQIHHLIHFHETGKHLDPRMLTLCAGSRDSVGYVPFARWSVDEFEVRWYDPASRNPLIGARQAVTLQTGPT